MPNHKKCEYCKQDIVLVPSAAERAKNCTQGLTAKDYKNLFTSHNDCQVAANNCRPNPRTGEIFGTKKTKPFMTT